MLSFKKVCSLGLATALVATGLMATTAQAADGDTTTSKTSTATFNVDSDGALTLDQVPSFNFGTIGATDLVTGKTVDQTDTDASNQVKVTDTTGHGAGYWTLNAQMTSPLTFETHTLPDASLKLALMAGSNSLKESTQTAGTTLTANDQTAQPVVAKDSAFPGTSTYTYTTTSFKGAPAATLTLPATASFTAGTYTSDITWTLQAAD